MKIKVFITKKKISLAFWGVVAFLKTQTFTKKFSVLFSGAFLILGGFFGGAWWWSVVFGGGWLCLVCLVVQGGVSVALAWSCLPFFALSRIGGGSGASCALGGGVCPPFASRPFLCRLLQKIHFFKTFPICKAKIRPFLCVFRCELGCFPLYLLDLLYEFVRFLASLVASAYLFYGFWCVFLAKISAIQSNRIRIFAKKSPSCWCVGAYERGVLG